MRLADVSLCHQQIRTNVRNGFVTHGLRAVGRLIRTHVRFVTLALS